MDDFFEFPPVPPTWGEQAGELRDGMAPVKPVELKRRANAGGVRDEAIEEKLIEYNLIEGKADDAGAIDAKMMDFVLKMMDLVLKLMILY